MCDPLFFFDTSERPSGFLGHLQPSSDVNLLPLKTKFGLSCYFDT